MVNHENTHTSNWAGRTYICKSTHVSRKYLGHEFEKGRVCERVRRLESKEGSEIIIISKDKRNEENVIFKL